MVTFCDRGGYVLFQLGPQVRIAMDARRETVYSETLVDLHTQDINYGTAAAITARRRVAPDRVWRLPPRTRPLRDWVAANHYRIDMESPSQFVALRDTRPPVTPVQPFDGLRCIPTP